MTTYEYRITRKGRINEEQYFENGKEVGIERARSMGQEFLDCRGALRELLINNGSVRGKVTLTLKK